MYRGNKAVITALSLFLLLFAAGVNAEQVDIWYGNPDGEPIETEIGQEFDFDIYIQTEDDVAIGSMVLCPGANMLYIDTLLNAENATLYYPLNEWDGAFFLSVQEYQDGWFTEPFQGFSELFPPWVSPALHFDVPTRVITMRMRSVTNPDYNNNVYEAFGYGEDNLQGPTNASDTSGTITYQVMEHFCLLQFGEPPPNDPPNEPSEPSPANGAIDQPVDVDLSWVCTDPNAGNILTYDLYFGTVTDPELYASDITTESFELPDLPENTTHYWKIVATDNYFESTDGPEWSFTTGVVPNNPPNAPADPNPSNDQTGVALDIEIEWSCSDPDGDDLDYNVYFGVDQSDLALIREHITENSVTFEEDLEYETTYYWNIVAYDTEGDSTVGDLWNFSTLFETNNPPDVPVIDANHNAPDSGAYSIGTDAILSWICSDPDGDQLRYNIYFGTSEEPELVGNMISDPLYEPGDMEYLTTYYWKVVAYDTEGDSTAGGLWHFTTGYTQEVFVWYGNLEQIPIDTEIGQPFDVDVYIYTDADVYIGDIMIALGYDNTYVDSSLNANEAEYHYPLSEWDAVYFNPIYEYRDGWFTESLVAFRELMPPYESPAINSPTPSMVATFKMKSVYNNDFAQQTFEAFEAGIDQIQGASNAADTDGVVVYEVGQYFNRLHFGQSGVDDNAPIPTEYMLAQNYPNPFNATTTIEFNLPQASSANIYIYDTQGRLVKQIENGVMAAGYHKITWNASSVPSGMYFYKLVTDNFSETKKMMLLK